MFALKNKARRCHNDGSSGLSDLLDKSVVTKPRHRDTTVHCNAVSRVDNAMTRKQNKEKETGKIILRVLRSTPEYQVKNMYDTQGAFEKKTNGMPPFFSSPGDGRDVLMSCMAVVVSPETLASLQCRDAGTSAFHRPAHIAQVKHEAP